MRSQNKAGLAALAMLAACGTPDRPRHAGRAVAGRAVAGGTVKVGPPYRAGGRTWVPRDDRGYDKVGEASWYGAAQRGRPTASGERFDPDGISAAHTTLPLPSWVEVTALGTGRTLLVRVNDRGPFVGGRIIDLSQGAARLLGIERAGVARVRVRRVFPSAGERPALRQGAAPPTRSIRVPPPPAAAYAPPPAASAVAAPVAPRPAPAAAADALFLDLGGFDDADRADAFASAASVVGSASVIGVGAAWRVRTGPYADDAAARAALARAGAAGYHDARIATDSTRDHR